MSDNIQNTEKKVAAEKATEFIESGMTVGLGTGSTVFYALNKIGELVSAGLKITAVSSSEATTNLAQSLNINIVSINNVSEIDITIDGADEVDYNFDGIKGGGGALLFEKIVALSSKKNIWIVDSKKLVNKLGKYPLPVEVIPFGFNKVFDKLVSMNLNPMIRKKDEEVYFTDSGNYIFDLHIGEIHNPVKLNNDLKLITGIVETGLFISIADIVIIGRENKVEILNR